MFSIGTFYWISYFAFCLCFSSISRLSCSFMLSIYLSLRSISSCSFLRIAIYFSSLWSSMTTLSPVSYKSTGTSLYMLKQSSMSRLMRATPNSTSTMIVWISSLFMYHGANNRYRVTPKAKIPMPNCRNYFFML